MASPVARETPVARPVAGSDNDFRRLGTEASRSREDIGGGGLLGFVGVLERLDVLAWPVLPD